MTGARVLVVDDELDVLEGLERLLSRAGYETGRASGAVAALDLLGQCAFDVVITDEQMPGQSGCELLGCVRDEYPDVIRIVLTGHASAESAIRAINEGQAFRFLQKPCSPPALLAAVREGMQQRAFARGRDQAFSAVEAYLGERERQGAASSTSRAGGAPASRRVTPGPHPDLRSSGVSVRELEVLRHLVSGLRVRQIASRLFISPHTVRNHLRALFRKLDLHSQQELLERASERSWFG